MSPDAFEKRVLNNRKISICAIYGGKPHAAYRGWRDYLRTCVVYDSVQGVGHFGKCNSNYILFPTGDLIENFGYRGPALMRDVRALGWRKVLNMHKKAHAEAQQYLKKLDRLVSVR